MSPTLFQLLALIALFGFGTSTILTSHSKENAFGLLENDAAYHDLCDQGRHVSLKTPGPRACFETKFHIADNLSNPSPSVLKGYIDASGKRGS